MATLDSTFYRFDQRRTANWTVTQEKSIAQDYPFLLQEESPEDYVARTYLQFLWLPDSLMPLHLLVPSLRRVNVPSSSNLDASVHPMHALLEPLLLKTRPLSDKYRVELPQILADGGGAGEMEETMMWYALTHEKPREGANSADEPWTDDVWREAYLERMERREVQIQILLYFYKFSLPGPPPQVTPPKKRSFRSRKPVEPELKPEDHLEALMDKMSMWQLIGNLDNVPSASATKKVDERDWIQMFGEDIVEQCFKQQLPELCSLLHSKVFPESPFSDDEGVLSDTPTSPRDSPEPHASTSRFPSPALSTASRTTNKLSRSRSRSLSVSLAQEQEERERASAAPSKKRILNREVSMSRVFKPKGKLQRTTSMSTKSEAPEPVKPQPKDTDVILVDETPQKPRKAPSTRTVSFGQPLFGTAAVKLPSLLKKDVVTVVEDDDDEEWMMQSSPDIVLLNPVRGSSASSGLMDMDSDAEDDQSAGQTTPSKPSGARRR